MFDLIDWLKRDALPLWADVGFDRGHGMFHEELDLRGRPLSDLPRRAMVQARQIFVFALADMAGWFPGGELAEQGGYTLLRVFADDAGAGGFAFSATCDGQIHDAERDLYAQAFALFALAWLARLTGRPFYLDVADRTLFFLDSKMATPWSGGYAEALRKCLGYRRQNPHMHLVEALLALHEADPQRGYLARAESLIELMTRSFLHGSSPVLVEFYDEALQPIDAASFAFEPGHHFEWAWLLAQHARLAGRAPPALAAHLWRSAKTTVRPDGWISELAQDDGRIRNETTRLWPYCEAIRAAAVGLADQADASAADRMTTTADVLHRLFLREARPGCWHDRLDSLGNPVSANVPASSLYHLAGAAYAMETNVR